MTFQSFVSRSLPIQKPTKLKTRRPRGSGSYRRPTKSGFRVGDRVTYQAWNGITMYGVVEKISWWRLNGQTQYQLKVKLASGWNDYISWDHANVI